MTKIRKKFDKFGPPLTPIKCPHCGCVDTVRVRRCDGMQSIKKYVDEKSLRNDKPIWSRSCISKYYTRDINAEYRRTHSNSIFSTGVALVSKPISSVYSRNFTICRNCASVLSDIPSFLRDETLDCMVKYRYRRYKRNTIK